MSAPYCLRLAIEACRPSKSSALRLRPLFQTRKITNTPTDGTGEAGAGGIPSSEPVGESVASTTPSPISRSHHHHHIGATPSKPVAEATPGATQTFTGEQKPFPPNVLAAYRVPMRHQASIGIPCASLQLRSYSVRNLEFFADFCMRAAYYLSLPARGPNPLPKRIERWTMPRSNFVHKKSKENFERITYKRLVTILDGEKSVVETWLAFVRKWQFYGVGMKANVWDWESVGVGKGMDKAYSEEIEERLNEKMKLFGFSESSKRSLEKMLERQGPRQVGVPMTNLREKSTTWQERKLIEFDETPAAQ